MSEEPKNFYDYFNEFVLQQLPTYQPWAESNAMFAISAVCPNAKLPGAGTGLDMHVNFLGIGPSRVGYKSTVMNYFTKPLLHRLECAIIPPRFTVEAMIGYLNQEEFKDVNHFVLFRDETSGMLAETQKKYMADEMTFLCEFIDGNIEERLTKTHGMETARGKKLQFMTCTTPHVFDIIDGGFWTQGLGNRLIHNYWYCEQNQQPQISTAFQMQEDYYHHKLSTCFGMLKKIKDAGVHRIQFDETVQKYLNIERFTRHNKAKEIYRDNVTSIKTGIYFETQVFIQKISAIFAINRKPCKNPVVTLEDWQKAREWCNKRYSEFLEILDAWSMTRLRKTARTTPIYIGPERKIRHMLKNAYPQGLTKTSFNNYNEITTDERNRILEQMVKEKKVKRKVERRGNNRVPVYFYVPKEGEVTKK